MKKAFPFLCLFLLAGCHRGMEHQPSKKPQASSPFFADGQASRPAVPGTVSREDETGPSETMTGMKNGVPVAVIPLPLSEAVLARGQERYGIFCAACHGLDGSGDGIVVRRGFPRPESFHTDRLRTAPAGHLFDAITRGSGPMASYAEQLPVADRWAVVAYIRALQLSQRAPAEALPPDLRHRLDSAKGGTP